MKSNNVLKPILLLVFFFFAGNIVAQPSEPDEDLDPEDGELNPAPIGDYVIPMLVVGVATAFVLLKKRDLATPNKNS